MKNNLFKKTTASRHKRKIRRPFASGVEFVSSRTKALLGTGQATHLYPVLNFRMSGYGESDSILTHPKGVRYHYAIARKRPARLASDEATIH